MFKGKKKSKKRKRKMIDERETTRPRRLASERAKAYFLSDASISKQLEKEERDLRKALKVSRMEALRARKNGNESKSVNCSSSSSSTTSTSSSKSSSSSSSSSPTSPLLSLPTTPKTTTKGTRTASVNQKLQRKMGKPKPMEISTKNIKGSGKTMNQVKPIDDDEKPKSPKWIIRTRSQNPNNNNNSNCQLVNYSLDSTDKEMFNCDKQKATTTTTITNQLNGKTIDPIQSNGTTKGILPSPLIPCANLPSGKDNGLIGLIPTVNGENCDKPRPRIMAQRKFASITYNCNTYLKPRDSDLSPIKELFTKHKPSAEDFLTFLCFKRTDLLPPHLDFYSLNNITSSSSSDGSNVPSNGINTTITNDKTANGINPVNLSDNKSTVKQPSNTSNNSSTSAIKTNSRNITNGKVQQSCRKRAMNFIIRKSVDNRKKEPDLVHANQMNRKNCIKSSNKNNSDCGTLKTNQRTNRTNTSGRPCKSPKKSTSRSDENEVKRSPLKKPPKASSSSRHKSHTEVKFTTFKEKINTNPKVDQKTINPIINGKVSKKSQPKLSNLNPDTRDRKKVERKVNCDRILRSNRASSSTSSTEPCLIVETPQEVLTNGKRSNIKAEKLDLTTIMINSKPEKSAINGNPVDKLDRKRKCNVADIIVVDNVKKRRTTTAPQSTVSTNCESRRPKKSGTIESSPETITSISEQLRKDSTTKSVGHNRIETRSHAKR
ncbi:putative mediator of RNA polymerase II transcription subunit 26 [Panonychus citri]|uniref:putative mediator of RNA polymerase II transcription subunit 26 n=1 Tax=Panonychus citri TaxID=50023 RepID=UPI00230765DD|nr:putative mediator of RNA polymerase II transcription subunit 26 [Panonychus citri]